MEDRLNAYRKRREREQEIKELAAKGCYSVILVIVALIALRPVMVEQILGRAEACSDVGLLEESRRQCEKALLIDGESSNAWYRMACVYLTEGNRDMAYGAFQKAVQADALNAAAHYQLGAMYVQDGRHQLAIPHLDKVRTIGPAKPARTVPAENCRHRAALDALASCYEKMGELAKAEFTLEAIRVYYPGSCDAEARLKRVKDRQANG